MKCFTQNGSEIFLGDFLDFHSASGAGHENDAAGGAIDEQAEIEFALDVQAFFDEQALDDAAGGTGLRGDQLHSADLTGELRGVVARNGEHSPSKISAPPRR